MNPYESSNAKPIRDTSSRSVEAGRFGIYIVQSLLISAFFASLLYVYAPWFRNWARPRFGSVGLSVCGNLIIFMMLRKPTRIAFVLSTLMFFVMGLLNARQLLQTVTVTVVENQFADRLHSSWLWCVFSCLIAGLYMAWLSTRTMPLIGAPLDTHPRDLGRS